MPRKGGKKPARKPAPAKKPQAKKSAPPKPAKKAPVMREREGLGEEE